MDYTYTAMGGLFLFGTSRFSVSLGYPVRYQIGQVVYDRHSAESHGRIIALVIKRYKVLPIQEDVLYTDTLNALWNERDLCSRSEALQLALAYYERIGNEAERALGRP